MEVSVTEFKAKCVGIVGKVQRERCRVVIRRHGRPAAELRPIEGHDGGEAWFGRAAGSAVIHGDLITTGEAWDAEG